MTVLVRFEEAFRRLETVIADPELLGDRLAAACAEVLPIAGAGISLFLPDGFRVPVGASGEMAARAERLQFTIGSGPCIEAHTTGRVVQVTTGAMAQRWPDFAGALTASTPFRAIVAAPLSIGMEAVGTTDLFLEDPDQLGVLEPDDIAAVAEAVSRRLAVAPPAAPDLGPAWLAGPASVRRNLVFVAIGMTSVDLDVSAPDALGLLRARALRDDSSVDELAAEIVSRRLPVADLRAGGAGS